MVEREQASVGGLRYLFFFRWKIRLVGAGNDSKWSLEIGVCAQGIAWVLL